MYEIMMNILRSVSAPSGDEEVAGVNVKLFLSQFDIVVLIPTPVEYSACVKFEETLSAQIVKYHIFVHNEKLDDGAVAGWAVTVNVSSHSMGLSFYPGTGLVLNSVVYPNPLLTLRMT